MESLNRSSQETVLNLVKGSKSEEMETEGDFDCNFEYEDDKEKIVEHSPRGRFIRFNEELGTGAFKTVYKAYDNDSGCEVAWNVMKLHKLPTKESKRILDEINLLKSLKHPNIISFISAWINKRKEEVVFISEIVSGGSLKSYLKKIKSPRLKVIKSWCREVLLALEYLHGMNPNPIIHRDLKCENIFINSNKGEIRIGDLGLATCLSTTFANSVIGTPHFMAPEMYEEEYDTAVDIYAFGMCLLEMVTLQIPYKECENPAQVFKKVMSGKKPQSLDMIQNEEVKAFILECLKDKDERPTAVQLLQSKFLTKQDDADKSIVKLLDGSPSKRSEEKNGSVANKVLDKPDKNGALSIKAGDSEHNHGSSEEDEKINIQFGKSKQEIMEKLVFEQTNESPPIASLSKEESPNRYREKLSHKRGDDDSILTYELTIKSTIKEYIYIIVKIKSQDEQYLEEKLIEIDRRLPTTEALASAIMKEFRIKAISPRFYQAILKFMEISQLALSTTSLKKSFSHPTSNTSHTTINPNANSKIYEPVTHFAEKGSSAISNANSTNFFQSECFLSHYQQYLNSLPKDYFSYETEESMKLRQKQELNELKKAHLMQKQSLLDRRQANLNNLISIPGLSDDFIIKDCDDLQKARTPHGADPMQVFSPISSDYMSADDVIVNDENTCFCQNNSTELMSMIGKFNGQNNSICDECNKSSLLLTAGEIAQHNGAGNHVSTPVNSTTREAINSTIQAQVLTSGFNPTSQFNSRFTPMISPKGNVDLNVQSFGSQPKRAHRQNNSQKQAFSPVILEQHRPLKVQESLGSHNQLNLNHLQEQEGDNKTAAPQNLFTALEEYQQVVVNRKSNERSKLTKQNSLDIVKTNEIIEVEPQIAKNEGVSLKRGHSQRVNGLVKQNSLTLSKAAWSDPMHLTGDSLYKELKMQDSPEGLRLRACPSGGNLQQRTILRPSNFVSEIAVKLSMPEDNLPESNGVSQVNSKFNSMTSLAGKLSNQGGNSLFIQDKKSNLTLMLPESSAGGLFGSKIISPQQAHHKGDPHLAQKDSFIFNVTEEGAGSNPHPMQKSPVEAQNGKDAKIYALADKILKHSIYGELRRGGVNMNEEDILLVQKCLEIITNTLLEANGIFGHYTEKVLKSYQEKLFLPADGVLTEQLWGRMKEDLEKRLKITLSDKEREIKEIATRASEDKKMLKEKQTKEAQECLYKIQAELIDLTKL